MHVNVLFIGDIMGKPGRRFVREHLPRLVSMHEVDIVVANGENSAGRAGITPSVAEELFDAGIDVITLGDHAWDRQDIMPVMDELEGLVRPANYPDAPGKGFVVVHTRGGFCLAVVNLLGRVFLPWQPSCPFRSADDLLEELKGRADAILVDFHAEATSEKVAMGWYLDGRVAAVVGTHTHVQTADERILPGGTAFISDAGMTGPADGVIGIERDRVIRRFLNQMPTQFMIAPGSRQFNGVLLNLEGETGFACGISRVSFREQDNTLHLSPLE